MNIKNQIEQSVELAYLEVDADAIGGNGVLYAWKMIDDRGSYAKSEPMAQTIGYDLGRNAIRTFDGKTYDVEVDVTVTVTELAPSVAREWNLLFREQSFDSTTMKKRAS